MSEAEKNQISLLSSGIFGTGIGIYFNYGDILNGEFPKNIIFLAVGLHLLLLAYLSPHIYPRGRRFKKIFEKAMSVNYFILFGTLTILILLTSSLGPLVLTSNQALTILFCIMALTFQEQ